MGLRKGWFKIDGVQNGDRTVDEQLQGLEQIDFAGKTVLDLGCAEGLISRHALTHGAACAHGLEIIGEHVEEARRQCAAFGDRARFWVGDMAFQWPGEWLPHYDVVLLLSSLHKLKHPLNALDRVAQIADTLVIRLPHRVLHDVRSAPLRQDIPNYLAERFVLTDEPKTCRGEWMGVFVREI